MVIHATDMENVNTARMASATTALRLQRAIISKASSPTKGIAISVAQKVKRSKVSTSKARPSSSLPTGVVPPNPRIAVKYQK